MCDSIYSVNLECIHSYSKAHFTPAMMTEFMMVCDTEMRACHQHIKINYRCIASIFSICADPSRFKLAQHKPYAVELLRICHLLVNINSCLKGNSASGYNAFDCSPPL
jgi:hypothetical protein